MGKVREYSKVILKTASAVQHLNAHGLVAALHLGDIIDGNVTLEQTHDDLQQTLNVLSELKVPVMHVLGNHCLDAGRDYLTEKLGLVKKGSYYYEDISNLWRIIVLDTVDVSITRGEDHEYRRLAEEYLETHAEDANAQEYNGGLGPAQLEWLGRVLEETKKQGKYAIVCGHLPILEEAAVAKLLVWDGERLEKILVDSGVVKAYFCGHHHEGGYAQREGIHHVTFEAILDSEDDGAVGVVELGNHSIVINGVGKLSSRNLKF